MNVATIQQKNICQERVVVQNEDTSSMENNSTPTGAPNAEETPAAAPAEIKFLLKIEIYTIILMASIWHLKILYSYMII